MMLAIYLYWYHLEEGDTYNGAMKICASLGLAPTNLLFPS
jgi:hypothetical protein